MRGVDPGFDPENVLALRASTISSSLNTRPTFTRVCPASTSLTSS
jgi:hypothetical protein